jgi:hypothetical protein
LQLLLVLKQGQLIFLALGDIGDKGDCMGPVAAVQVAQADVDRELGAIMAQTGQFQAGVHGTVAGLRKPVRQKRVVPFSQARGNQLLNRLTASS